MLLLQSKFLLNNHVVGHGERVRLVEEEAEREGKKERGRVVLFSGHEGGGEAAWYPLLVHV